MNQQNITYDVFLSYTTRDHAAVEQVGRWLQQQGLTCFIDRWYLVPGVPWPEALEQALDQSNAVAIFLGPGELGRWQQREQYLAIDRKTDGSPIIPVLLPGSDPPLGFLSLNTWVDLRAGINDRPLKILAAAISGKPSAEVDREAIATKRTVCPFRGLLPYREEDAPFFFGRQDSTKKLVEVVEKHSFVLVVGASGSGKSSVVRAGLVPELRRAKRGTVWEVTTIVPTDRPFWAMASAFVPLLEPDMSEVERLDGIDKLAESFESRPDRLRDVVTRVLDKQQGTKQLLLVVDQWEELYTLCRDKRIINGFVDQLLSASENSPLSVVATCRGDFYGRILEHRPLVDCIDDAQITVGPMKPAELSGVIEKPAEKVGLELEPGLAKRILEDVGNEAGRLPLLSFVLEQLWERRRGVLLTNDTYDEIGRIQGAIAQKAEDVFTSLTEEEQNLLPKIFNQVVSVGEDAQDTRRRASVSTLGEEARPVIKKLADARLLVTSSEENTPEENVEVAHEALIRHWHRSQGWVNQARGFLIWRRRLEPFVDEWKKDSKALLRGGLLAEAERWLSERRGDLDDTECGLIDASLRQREKHNQRRNLFLISMAIATVAAICFGVIANWNAERATRNAYNLQLLRMQDICWQNPSLAATLLEDETTCTDDLKDFTWRFLYRLAKRRRQTLSGHKGLVHSVAFSPDGKTLASASWDKTVKLWDVASGSERQTLSGHKGLVYSVAFSPDGKTLASASDDKTVKLWDAASGSERQTLSGHKGLVYSVAFSPDGKTLASASDDKTIKLWDAASGSERQTLSGHEHTVLSVAFSPDGKTLASASRDKTVKLWDAASGSERQTLSGHERSVWSVAFSPDGKTLASASEDKTVKLWDAASGSERQTLSGHEHTVLSVAFSPDGKTLASASWDKTVKLWDAASGSERQTLSGHEHMVLSVAFSPDGKTLASASWDKTVKLWDVASGSERQTLSGHERPVWSVAFSPDGKTLASASDDKTVKLWDAASGSERQTLSGHTVSVWSVAFSPDGKTLASASFDKTVKLWDAASGSERQTLSGHKGFVNSVTFSPDGKTLASASFDKTVKLWDAASGSERQTLSGHENTVLSVAFSPDGKTLASASDDKTVKLWDAARGIERQTLSGHEGPVWSVAFSPDGKTLASASRDKTVKLWDAASGSERQTLSGHKGFLVSSVAFSPDGKTLASASSDGTIKLW